MGAGGRLSYRHHRRWMLAVNLGMGACLIWLSAQSGFGPSVWIAIGLFTLLSATNDIAIDGYTIELLDRHEYGMANGVRIGFYRVGMIFAGVVLILSGWFGWSVAYLLGGAVFIAQRRAWRCSRRREGATRQRAEQLAVELRLLRDQPLWIAGARPGAPRAAVAARSRRSPSSPAGASVARVEPDLVVPRRACRSA